MAEHVRKQLQWYGISDVISLGRDDDLSELMDDLPSEGDAIVISSGQQLIPAVTRLLTVRSVRTPSHFVVWNPNDGGRIVAARMASADLLQMNYHNHWDLDDELRKLVDIKKLHRYAIDDIVANDAVRVGGSFAKSGVQRYFHKQARNRGSLKLRDEAGFYERLPEELRPHYPEVLFSRTAGDSVQLGLEYVAHPNLRDLLLNLEITPRDAANVLTRVLDYEYNKAYLKHLRETPANYVQDYHFDRVWSRLAVTIDLDPDFAPLIHSRRLSINGRVIANVPAMLSQLEQHPRAVAELTPPGASPHIHGDLHLENILYDRESDHFWLVDPRGYPVCDIYYDLGKLSHSYNGYYDLLHEGRHEVGYHVDGDTAVVEFSLNSPQLEGVYGQLSRIMQDVVVDLLQEDRERANLRINFNEAMHFCSDMPFHINPDASPNVAMAIYATGALLLADVLREFDIDPDAAADAHHRGLSRMTEATHRTWRLDG
ncbi:MAG TPA: hypothetical protein VFR17_11090 [Mycobacterium sp.]|nr:hypothetical protein [Mycobacterium sp.]